MPTKWLVSTVLICLMAGGPSLSAQQAPAVQVIDHEYEIKAKYLYYLAQFVTPQNSDAASSGALVIAVIGPSTKLFQEVNKNAAYRSMRNQKVEWRAYATVAEFIAAFPSGTPTPPRLVFLMTPPTEVSLDEVSKQATDHLSGLPVLIVTEDDDQFRKSVAVNIFEDKAANRLRMQLRQSSLRERQLQALEAFLKSPAVVLY